MNQQKYIVFAIIILLSGSIIFFFIKKISETKHEENPSSARIIDYKYPKKDLDTMQIDGKKLFQQNCVSCHNIFKDLVGPSLMHVDERWPDKKKLYDFIKHPSLLNKDPYLKKLKKKYGDTAHPVYSDLTNYQIDAIFSYIESELKNETLPIP